MNHFRFIKKKIRVKYIYELLKEITETQGCKREIVYF